MFCNKCGELNKDHSNYCNNDGENLKKNNKKIKMKKIEAKYCGDCGDKTNTTDSYCGNCGYSFFESQRIDKKININEVVTIKNKESISIDSFDFRNIVKYGAIAFFIVLFINFALSSLTNAGIKMFMADEIGVDYSQVKNMFKGFKLVSFLDLTLLSNLSGIELSIKSMDIASGEMFLKGGLHLLMIIPSFIFIAIGVVRAKSDLKNNMQINLKNIIGSSIIYTLFLILTIFINKKSLSIPMNMFMGEGSIELYKKFNIPSTLFAGLFISIAFTFIGYALYCKLKKREDLFGQYNYILQGSFNFISTLLLMTIFTFIMLRVYIGEDIFRGRMGILVFAILFISPYVFLIMNFGSLNMFSMDYYYNEPLNVHISLFDLDFLKNEVLYGLEFKYIYIYLGILVLATVFFLSGRSITKKFGGDIKNILYTSAFYSVLTTLFAQIIKITLNVNGEILFLSSDELGQATAEFNFISVLIGAFILSTLFMFLGSKFSRNNE